MAVGAQGRRTIYYVQSEKGGKGTIGPDTGEFGEHCGGLCGWIVLLRGGGGMVEGL